VYGDAAPEIEGACRERKLPLHLFAWRQEMSRTGLQRNALYLVRPDGYVAFAHPSGGAIAIIDYLNARQLAQTTRSR
jgi:hypothetical protein